MKRNYPTFKQAGFLILITLLISACTHSKPKESFLEQHDRIVYQLELNEYLFRMRQNIVYLNGSDSDFKIVYYNNKVIYAASLNKETNEPKEEIVFFKEKWYHINNDKIRIEINSKEAIRFVEWIFVEVNKFEKSNT